MLRDKSGNQMVEAAIVMPVVVLAVILLLRVFTFYLEILSTGIKEHEKALKMWNSYKGIGFKQYENIIEVELLKGAFLGSDYSKKIETKAYFYNEDNIVRGRFIVSE